MHAARNQVRVEHAQAADPRHQQIEQDRVVGVVAGEPQRLLAGAGELRLDVDSLESRRASSMRVDSSVVDDEDAVARLQRFLRS